MRTALPLASALVLFSLGVIEVGRNVLQLSAGQIQTLAFLTLVFGGQGTVYLVRERRHFWKSTPSRWMLISSAADLVAVSVVAMRGILMAPLAPLIVVGLVLSILIYLLIVDNLKIAIFARA